MLWPSTALAPFSHSGVWSDEEQLYFPWYTNYWLDLTVVMLILFHYVNNVMWKYWDDLYCFSLRGFIWVGKACFPSLRDLIWLRQFYCPLLKDLIWFRTFFCSLLRALFELGQTVSPHWGTCFYFGYLFSLMEGQLYTSYFEWGQLHFSLFSDLI